MDIISAIICVIGIIFIFSFGFFLGYREGMATMKRIDDNIIEEARYSLDEIAEVFAKMKETNNG